MTALPNKNAPAIAILKDARTRAVSQLADDEQRLAVVAKDLLAAQRRCEASEAEIASIDAAIGVLQRANWTHVTLSDESALSDADHLREIFSATADLAGSLDVQPLVPRRQRKLKPGEFQLGDRVRYTGRVAGTTLRLVGRTGTVRDFTRVSALVEFDDEPDRRPSISTANLEHESLPQFEVGDRVRVTRDVGQVFAGDEGRLTQHIGGTIPFLLSLDSGMVVGMTTDAIELVRPVQADGG